MNRQTSGPWKVCPDCEGKGTKDTLGAMTSDYLDEQFGNGLEREEFMEQYLSGMFDKPCGYCEGRTTVIQERYEDFQGELEYRAEVAAEMRMGA